MDHHRCRRIHRLPCRRPFPPTRRPRRPRRQPEPPRRHRKTWSGFAPRASLTSSAPMYATPPRCGRFSAATRTPTRSCTRRASRRDHKRRRPAPRFRGRTRLGTFNVARSRPHHRARASRPSFTARRTKSTAILNMFTSLNATAVTLMPIGRWALMRSSPRFSLALWLLQRRW